MELFWWKSLTAESYLVEIFLLNKNMKTATSEKIFLYILQTLRDPSSLLFIMEI